MSDETQDEQEQAAEETPAQPAMTQAVALRQPSVQIEEAQTMNAVAAWGRLMADSGFFKDARTAAQAAVKILAGRELGFGVMESMTGIYIIDNRPVLSAGLMANAVKRSGRYNYSVAEHDDDHCIIEFWERDDGRWVKIGTSEWTTDDANRAGLLRAQSNWEKYPKSMVFARAMSNGVRWYCPDVFGQTVYTPEEIRPDIDVNADGEILNIDQIVIEPPQPQQRLQPQRQQRDDQPPRDRSGGRDAPAPAAASTRKPREAKRKLTAADVGAVKDLPSLMTWVAEAFGVEATRGVPALLEVETTAAISAKLTSPDDYHEAALTLLHHFDAAAYDAEMAKVLGDDVDPAAQSEYDAEQAGPEDAADTTEAAADQE